MSKSLLPFVASSLNDVYSKLDGLSNQIKQLGNQFNDFLEDLNQKISDAIQKIGKIEDTLKEVEVLEEYKSINQLFRSTMDQLNEGLWYVDFILALKRILNVVRDIET